MSIVNALLNLLQNMQIETLLAVVFSITNESWCF